jgi:hypothetical protein
MVIAVARAAGVCRRRIMLVALIWTAGVSRRRSVLVSPIPVAWVKRGTRIVGAGKVVDYKRAIVRVLDLVQSPRTHSDAFVHPARLIPKCRVGSI